MGRYEERQREGHGPLGLGHFRTCVCGTGRWGGVVSGRPMKEPDRAGDLRRSLETPDLTDGGTVQDVSVRKTPVYCL